MTKARADRVYATPERRGKRGGLKAYQTESAGVFADQGYDNALDFMLDEGWLGDGEEATRRHSTAMELKALYVKTHRERLIGSYGAIIPGESEMTEQEAWNLRAFFDLARYNAQAWRVLEPVICDDRLPMLLSKFNEALDAMREWAEARALRG